MAELVAEALGGSGLETVGPALDDRQNLMEIACLAFDRARMPQGPAPAGAMREGLEALPLVAVSKGLGRQVGAEGARRLATGAP